MNLYETTFIVNPQVEEAEIDKHVQAVSKLITDNGGKIVHEEKTGTRRLAYPIRGLQQGYYATFLFESEPKVLPKIDRHMKLGDSYMRYLTIIFDGDPEIVYGEKSARPFDSDRDEDSDRHGRGGYRDRDNRRGGGGYRGHRDRNDDYRPNPRKRRD